MASGTTLRASLPLPNPPPLTRERGPENGVMPEVRPRASAPTPDLSLAVSGEGTENEVRLRRC